MEVILLLLLLFLPPHKITTPEDAQRTTKEFMNLVDNLTHFWLSHFARVEKTHEVSNFS